MGGEIVRGKISKFLNFFLMLLTFSGIQSMEYILWNTVDEKLH